MSLFIADKKPTVADNLIFVNQLNLNEEEQQIAELIQRRRLQLLVHSRIYYNLDHNIIEDKQWDILAKELVQLQLEYPTIADQVCYAAAFKDWDATTGAFLPLDDEWVKAKANQLVKLNYTPGIKNTVSINRVIQTTAKPKKLKEKKSGGLF